MKKLIIILTILISAASLSAKDHKPVSVNNTIHSNIGSEYTEYINFICNELDIKNVTIHVNKLPSHIGIFGSTDLLGYVEKKVFESGTSYYIYIKASQSRVRDVHIVLGHEVTHIMQDLDGYDIIEKGSVTIKNKKMSYSSDTSERLENEAVRSALRLRKSYRVATKPHK